MEVSSSSGGTNHSLETVRLLHETVLALRTALEGSRKELEELRSRYKSRNEEDKKNGLKNLESMDKASCHEGGSDIKLEEEEEEEDEDDAFVEEKPDSGGESEEIDDIELVFTTEETDPGVIHEDMVPICDEKKPLMHTVIVETDISKCGVIDENEMIPGCRRNTLPDPLPYRPIIHREILAAARAERESPSKAKPPDQNSARQETGAQTDITAVPTLWKSETYLAHKISYNLTTLPSKFNLPVPRLNQLPLSDKSREARRVLLSDINFTSMVPELSRSADHLHQDEDLQRNQTEYMKSCGSNWEGRIPEMGKHESRSSWGSRYQTSVTSITAEEFRRRNSCSKCCHTHHSWTSAPSFRCHSIHHVIHPEELCSNTCITTRKIKNRNSGYRCCPAGHSLPDLRGDCDSGESTDSLIEEAEEFLRRSIDNMMIQKTKKVDRRCSEPDSSFGFEPSKSAQPFLPKSPNDLKQDSLVKVITADGRIVMGRVRYSGYVIGKVEPYVGIELGSSSGGSDGTFLDHRYFDCKPDHAIFVPFKKVVLAWYT